MVHVEKTGEREDGGMRTRFPRSQKVDEASNDEEHEESDLSLLAI